MNKHQEWPLDMMDRQAAGLPLVGVLLCLLSAAAFGSMAILGKFAFTAGVTTDTLLVIRFALAALVLWSVVAASSRGRRDAAGSHPTRALARHAQKARRRALIVAFVALGCVGYAAQASLFFAALEVMDASALTVIFYVYPAFVTLAGATLGRERLTRSTVVTLVVASLGVGMVVLGAGGAGLHPLGVGLALVTALVYTGYILIADRVTPYVRPATLAAVVMSGATLTMLVRTSLNGGPDLGFQPVGWLWIGVIAIICTALAMITFFAGLALVGATTAAIVSMVEPLVTAVLATLVLGETPTLVQVLGGSLVLAAVTALQVRRSRPTGELPVVPTAPESLVPASPGGALPARL